MRIIIKLFSFIVLICYSLTLFSADSKNQPQTPDVRLLVDISGSMKKNDPNNLRIPALQLVTNLMPQNAKAGVWAFGRSVNMLVPLGKVDSVWQNKATEAAKKINSAGLFTNIGGVLKSASYGWRSPAPSEKRSMILLTDGVVDISKDPKVNEAERNKILNTLLPTLISENVTIHTIALSQNADHELLKKLSTETDGWYQAVESAEELQKVFLKIFEQSAARDSLPLTNNQFNVDTSIEEMTLLVFKEDASDTTKLVSPDKRIIDGATKDGSVRWFKTSDYDLITIKKPLEGGWQIDAGVDPDNRVMVVSKLSLNVAPVPNNLLAGEAINYEVGLLEEGEKITKPDFLKLVEARLTQTKAGKTNRLAMFFDSNDHQFKQNFFTDSEEGVLNLTLEIKSPTFERTRNHAVNIYGSPLEHEIELSNKESSPHKLLLKVREDIVKADSLVVSLTLNLPDGSKQFLAVEDITNPVDIANFPAGGEYSISLDIKGKSILGRAFSVSPQPINFTSLPTPEYLASLESKKEPEKIQEAVIEPTSKPVKELSKEPIVEKTISDEVIDTSVEEENDTDWTMWLIIGIVGNIILAGLGILAWKIIKSKNTRNVASLSEELSIDEDDEDEDEDEDEDDRDDNDEEKQ